MTSSPKGLDHADALHPGAALTRSVAEPLPRRRAAHRDAGTCPRDGAVCAAGPAAISYHGIVAQPAVPPANGFGTVGEALLATCREARASLLVMGAYTRSRIHESYLGGVTRHVLQNARIPVLLSY
jgi:Universal stress protein family